MSLFKLAVVAVSANALSLIRNPIDPWTIAISPPIEAFIIPVPTVTSPAKVDDKSL